MIASWNTIIGFDFEQEILLPPSETSNTAVRFTSFAAGHVLGACMFLIEIAGTRVLYTGDYSTEEDRHLVPAKVPVWEKKPDVMICESTYGCVARAVGILRVGAKRCVLCVQSAKSRASAGEGGAVHE